MSVVRAIATAAVLATWPGPAAALDRQKAIEVAKKEAGERCAGETPCTFTAKVEEGKWHVRVDFPKDAPPSRSKAKFGGHTIYIINQMGRIVGRIEAKK